MRVHAEVTRRGDGWLVHVKELNQSIVAQRPDDIVPQAFSLIGSQTRTPSEQVVLVVLSERDSVRRRAAGLGFEQLAEGPPRTDIFQIPGKPRSVAVRYDDYGAVVDVHATTQVAEYHPTRDGAYDALAYTADYSDIKRRRLKSF